MAGTRCQVNGCTYVVPEDTVALMAPMVYQAHLLNHGQGGKPRTEKLEKLRRPTISLGGTRETWERFKTRWREFSHMYELEGTPLILQLLECCDEPLRTAVSCDTGGETLGGRTEEDVMAAIKEQAVIQENVRVARVTLYNMRQGRDEPIRAFCAGCPMRPQREVPRLQGLRQLCRGRSRKRHLCRTRRPGRPERHVQRREPGKNRTGATQVRGGQRNGQTRHIQAGHPPDPRVHQ